MHDTRHSQKRCKKQKVIMSTETAEAGSKKKLTNLAKNYFINTTTDCNCIKYFKLIYVTMRMYRCIRVLVSPMSTASKGLWMPREESL